MKKIKIAFIGLGHDHAKPNVSSFSKQTELYEVAGYHIPEDDELQYGIEYVQDAIDGMKELTLDEILTDSTIEAAVIETVDKKLVKYALLAAKAGKHIFMDKAGSGNFEEFAQLIREVKKQNIVFQTGYMYRYNPYVKELKEQIKRGELGEIIGIEAQMNCIHKPEKRSWLADYPGGMMHFLGCHLVDLIYSIQGKPENVIPLNRRSGLGGATGEDIGMAVFDYKNGVSFVKTSGVEYGGFDRRNFTVIGSKKTVELCPFEQYEGEDKKMYTQKTEYTEWDWENKGEKDKIYLNRYDEMTGSLAKYINGEEKNPFTLDYELELYNLLLKACGL